jgi:hypothetical protein
MADLGEFHQEMPYTWYSANWPLYIASGFFFFMFAIFLWPFIKTWIEEGFDLTMLIIEIVFLVLTLWPIYAGQVRKKLIYRVDLVAGKLSLLMGRAKFELDLREVDYTDFRPARWYKSYKAKPLVFYKNRYRHHVYIVDVDKFREAVGAWVKAEKILA